MTTIAEPALHAGTPALTALDVRGSTVRELQCYREAADDAVDLRITRHRHGPRGQMIESLDPRLASTSPNFRWQHDLAGQPLRTDSVDAGVTLALADIAGRALLAISATGVRQTSTYEDSTLPGRLQAVLEQAPGAVAAQVTDRFCWAGLSSAEKDLNLSGQCVRHYDTAGLNQLQRGGINGAVLAQSRQLLAGEQAANWAGDSEQGWQAALDAEAFVTQRTVDATGAQLTQTDACGHVQRLAYDLTGQLRGSWLTLQSQAEQVIVASLRYSAMGQKVQEVHGNGVVTDYDYAPRTQQLIGIRVQRPATARSTARVLQDLRYTYDPVGNVLNVRNDAEATRFWRNQKVVPEQAFVYDSLYQLVQATGREMAIRGQQGSQLPAALVPLPSNDDAYTPYTRTYRYDRAGNLTHNQHSAPASNNNYTTQLTVSSRSNRAVLAQAGLLPEDVDAQFDDGGNQLALLPGQNLRWNLRGELAQVAPIQREGQPDDREWYRYGSDAMRVLKVSQQQAAGATHVQRVLYLEGLEVRSTWGGEEVNERLEVVGIGADVRVLHWASGLPGELKNGQVRYRYHNLIGSSGLELDAQGEVISLEEYYPFGGTAVWTARSQIEVNYKTIRYSGKERDSTGLYYYGYRYYQPWVGRWLSADPGETIDGLNLYRMVKNNPLTLHDPDGMKSEKEGVVLDFFRQEGEAGQAYLLNLQRQYRNKPLRRVLVLDDYMKSKYEEILAVVAADYTEYIDKESVKLSGLRASFGWFQKILRFFNVSKVWHEIQKVEANVSQSKDALKVAQNMRVELASSVLNGLDPAANKIYLIGHGGVNSDFLGDGAIDSSSFARLLFDLRLPRTFIDIRVLSCHSADASMPASFSAADLESASQIGGLSFGQRLLNHLRTLGYENTEVTAYHGKMQIGYHQHNQGVLGDTKIRRSQVKETFTRVRTR